MNRLIKFVITHAVVVSVLCSSVYGNTEGKVLEKPVNIKVAWDFYAYDEPSFYSDKECFFKAQTIAAKADAGGGWFLIDTSSGEKWINCMQNSIFIDRYFYLYNDESFTQRDELMKPQLVSVKKTSRENCLMISTWKGDKWINTGEIIDKLVFETKVYDQRIKHYNGCEAYAATMALNALGVEITPDAFIEFVPQNVTKYSRSGGKAVWGDPDLEFVGNMKNNGYAAYPPVIVKAINENFDKVVAKDISGADFEDIVDVISHGGFACIWFHPSGQSVREPSVWYTPEGKRINADFGTHTVTVLGYNVPEKTVTVNDSLSNSTYKIKWSNIAATYNETNKKAVSIMPRI